MAFSASIPLPPRRAFLLECPAHCAYGTKGRRQACRQRPATLRTYFLRRHIARRRWLNSTAHHRVRDLRRQIIDGFFAVAPLGQVGVQRDGGVALTALGGLGTIPFVGTVGAMPGAWPLHRYLHAQTTLPLSPRGYQINQRPAYLPCRMNLRTPLNDAKRQWTLVKLL
jgi:hypothetical protein